MKLFGTITLASCLLLPPLAPAGPISYQGRLDDNGQPANGLYSMRFTVFDDAVAGAALDSGVTVSNIPVSDGLFTARFDVNDIAIAEAEATWLQIEVFRLGSGFEVLSPRQPMDPPPLARQAAGALKLENGDVVLQRGGGVVTMVSTLGTTPIQGFPTPTSAWQSFTATADGPIADAWMQLDLVGADSVEFRIYEGEGTGGNLLATDAGALVSTTNGNTFGASPAAQVTEGQLYTLEIVGVAAGGTSPTFRIPFDDLGYTGGKANLQPQDGSPQVNDYFFRVRVQRPDVDTIVARDDGTLRTNGLVVTNPTRVDLSVNAVQMDEIEGEPGTAVAGGYRGFVEPAGPPSFETVVATETIGVPRMPGRIIAMFSGSIAVDKKATSPNLAMTLVIRPAGEPRGIGYAYVRIPNTAGEGLWEMPVSFMGFDDVDGGAMTYNVTAFVPEESARTFNITTSRFYLFWMPTSYDLDLPDP